MRLVRASPRCGQFEPVFFLCPQKSSSPSPYLPIASGHWLKLRHSSHRPPCVEKFRVRGSADLTTRSQTAPHSRVRSTDFNMSGNPGTYRGTPNRGQGRGGIPFANSPGASAIPRPVLETTQGASSEAGISSVSASRQKQSKRDEVCLSLASIKPRLNFPRNSPPRGLAMLVPWRYLAVTSPHNDGG